MIRRLASSKGQSLIEFTLLMPLLIVLALGVVEFGAGSCSTSTS